MTIRSLNKLRPGDVMTLADGSHSDGGGLYLWVHDGGRLRSWIFRYTVAGRVREMGLGKAGEGGVDLKAARAKRDDLCALLDSGLDPLAERRRRRAEQDAKRTFAEVAQLTLAKKVNGSKGGERSTSFTAWVRTIDVEAKALHRLTWRTRPCEHFPSRRAWNAWNARFCRAASGSARSQGLPPRRNAGQEMGGSSRHLGDDDRGVAARPNRPRERRP